MIHVSLQHPLVRDLAWLIEGHYIVQDFDLAPYWHQEVNTQLMALDASPEPLIEAISSCKSHFLGSYFETLFSFALTHFSTLRVVLEHLQIDSDGRTLGEIDALVETPEGDFFHIELAIKYYLERPDLAPNDWIGPNKNDSLFKKVTKAREHQLKILQTAEGKAAINHLVQGRDTSARLLVFGRLYQWLSDESVIEKWLDQEEFGGWIRVSNLSVLARYCSHYQVLEKPHWLSNPNCVNNFTFFSEEFTYNLVRNFLQDVRPLHMAVWGKVGDVKRNVFVVPDSW